VQERIAELRTAVLSAQNGDGSWEYGGYPVGITALAVLALRHAQVPADGDAIRRATAFIDRHTDSKVYSEGLVLCALEQVDPAAFKKRMQRAARFLLAAQNVNGTWGYGRRRGSFDNSNTQFAILGLAAGERCGIAMPDFTRKRSVRWFVGAQTRGSGGWGYRGSDSGEMLSMSCAGVASLSLLGWELEQVGERCGEYKVNKALSSGLNSITRSMRGDESGWGGGWDSYYALYALERVGIFLDLKTIGGIDWYRMGADHVVGRDMPGGISDKCFALLFLAKGFAPIAVAKWQWDGDWNNDHADVKNWVMETGRELKRKLDWVPARLGEAGNPAAKASMIFVNGHKRFKASEADLTFVRTYLQNRGTLVGEACCGSKQFLESFKRVMETRLYPNRRMRFVPVNRNHPITHSVHALTPRQLCVYELKGNTCRKERVLLLSRDISCALNGDKGTEAEQPLARRIAVNILAWVLGIRDATRRLDTPRLAQIDPLINETDVDFRVARAGQAFEHAFGRLKHRGDWLTDPGFHGRLASLCKSHPSLPVFDGELNVHPLSADMFHAAMLFVTGHEAPNLKDSECINLRRYLQNGGSLMASACCGTPDFDAGFRLLMKQVLPNDELARIPEGDAILQRPFPLRTRPAAGTAAYRERFGRRWAPLHGIKRDGRWIVVYSPVDFCCAFEGDMEDEAPCYALESASPLVANILHYAFTE